MKLKNQVKIKIKTVTRTMIMKMMMMRVMRVLNDQLVCIKSEEKSG